MRKHVSSLAWMGAAGAALWLTVMQFPPGGVPWHVFFTEETAVALKLKYLSGVYVVPAVLAFVGIVLFQLQFS